MALRQLPFEGRENVFHDGRQASVAALVIRRSS